MKQLALPVAISAVLFSSAGIAGQVITDGPDIKISTKGGLKAATTDGNYSVQIGGRLQWDYDNTEYDVPTGGTNNTDDFDVRRARIFVKGHAGDWAYKIQFNVAEGDGADGGDAEDLYIRYTGFGKQANITLGKQNEPFGLELQTSSKDTSSLERSAITERYVPGRNGGIQLHGKGSNWTYGIGYFEANGDSDDDFGDTAITGRATFAPIKTDESVLHLGIGYTDRDEALDSDGEIDSVEFEAYNLELAGVAGPFHAQAEYFDGEEGDEDIDGYYVQAGWVITGEQRPYKDGKFKKVKPAGKSGAWELVVRHEEGDGKFSDIGLSSGDGEQTTFGINFYANSNVRLGLSYMEGEIDTGSETLDGDELRFRTQFTF